MPVHRHFDRMQVNVKTKRCEEQACRRLANYGYPGESRVRCSAHKLDGMVSDSVAVPVVTAPMLHD